MELHSERERYRGTLSARNPDNEPATLIVLRRGKHIWLTFDGGIRTSLAMTDDESTRLVELVRAAQRA